MLKKEIRLKASLLERFLKITRSGPESIQLFLAVVIQVVFYGVKEEPPVLDLPQMQDGRGESIASMELVFPVKGERTFKEHLVIAGDLRIRYEEEPEEIAACVVCAESAGLAEEYARKRDAGICFCYDTERKCFSVSFREGSYSEKTARIYADMINRALTAVLERPDIPIREIMLWEETERRAEIQKELRFQTLPLFLSEIMERYRKRYFLTTDVTLPLGMQSFLSGDGRVPGMDEAGACVFQKQAHMLQKEWKGSDLKVSLCKTEKGVLALYQGDRDFLELFDGYRNMRTIYRAVKYNNWKIKGIFWRTGWGIGKEPETQAQQFSVLTGSWEEFCRCIKTLWDGQVLAFIGCRPEAGSKAPGPAAEHGASTGFQSFSRRNEWKKESVWLFGDSGAFNGIRFWTLARKLKEQGIRCMVRHMEDTGEKEGEYLNWTAEALRLAGICVNQAYQLAPALSLAKKLRKHRPDLKIFLFGDLASRFPRELEREPGIDLVLENSSLDTCIKELGKELGEKEENEADEFTRLMDWLAPFPAVQNKDTTEELERLRRELSRNLEHTSELFFDFGFLEPSELLSFCRRLWEGLPLKGHFCRAISRTSVPEELLRLASDTFFSARWLVPDVPRAEEDTSYEEILYCSELEQRGHALPERCYRDEEKNQHLSSFKSSINWRIAEEETAPFLTCSYTYGELDEKSEALSACLLKKGVGIGDRIMLLCGSPYWFTVSLLAIIKTGAVYVPADIANPPKRLSALAKAADTRLILSDQEGIELTGLNGFLDVRKQPLSPGEKGKRPEVRGEDTACLIFTSGTTGEPKGVLISHRSLCNYIQWRIEEYGFTETDVTLQTLSNAFDGFYSNFYSALMSGGRLVYLQPHRSRQYDQLPGLIQRTGVTNLSTIPQVAGELYRYGGEEQLSTLRFLVLAGQRCTGDTIAAIRTKTPGIQLINEYGPTECCIAVAYKKDLQEENGNIIGSPIWNTGLYILNHRGQKLPEGLEGEICVTGASLAIGYAGRADLTEEKFPQSLHLGTRYYKTGDLGVMEETGELRIYGRLDGQIKLRGYRMEPHEIEEIMRKEPGVLDAAVMLENESGKEILAGYYTAIRQTGPEAIRARLQESLPPYMVVQKLIKVSEIPRNTSGKIDRQRLITLERKEQEPKGKIQEPENETERMLASVWEEVLNQRPIGITDDFFELGGNSFNALTVVSRCGRLFSVEELFEYSTIKGLYENAIVKKQKTGILRKLLDGERTRWTLLCIPFGGGNSTAFYSLTREIKKKMDTVTVYAINLPGHEKLGEELVSIEETARRIVEELKKEQYEGKLAVYSHCGNGAALALELLHLCRKNQIPLSRVFIGAALPQEGTGLILNLARKSSAAVPDKMLYQRLKALGFDICVDSEYLKEWLAVFRHDGSSTMEYYRRNREERKQWGKFDTEIVNIIGEKDNATKDYPKKALLWKRYSDQVRLEVLADVGHYFLNSHAEQLAGILYGYMTEGKEG